MPSPPMPARTALRWVAPRRASFTQPPLDAHHAQSAAARERDGVSRRRCSALARVFDRPATIANKDHAMCDSD